MTQLAYFQVLIPVSGLDTDEANSFIEKIRNSFECNRIIDCEKFFFIPTCDETIKHITIRMIGTREI